MKYPAIVENNQLLFVAFSRHCVVAYNGTTKLAPDYTDADKMRNVTAEYLANTYGEVKSKEHAEFIKLLAETNKIPCAVVSIDMNYTMFYVIDGCLFFCVKEIDAVGDYNKITIPLPPECEERKPKEVIANGKKHTLNLVTGFYDFSVIELGYVSGSTLKKLQEADDYQVLSFVDECDGSKEDEWPKVGSSVEWGHTGKGEVKSLSDGFAWVKLDNKDYTTVYISSLRKPKTPEQIMQENLINIYESSLDGGHFVDNLLSEYTLTKKPQ